jgi:hypothetical protein
MTKYLIKYLTGPKAINPRYCEMPGESLRDAVRKFRRLFAERTIIVDVFGPPVEIAEWE